jgi:hypothetical protein
MSIPEYEYTIALDEEVCRLILKLGLVITTLSEGFSENVNGLTHTPPSAGQPPWGEKAVAALMVLPVNVESTHCRFDSINCGPARTSKTTVGVTLAAPKVASDVSTDTATPKVQPAGIQNQGLLSTSGITANTGYPLNIGEAVAPTIPGERVASPVETARSDIAVLSTVRVSPRNRSVDCWEQYHSAC